jgi:hypothetical protein
VSGDERRPGETSRVLAARNSRIVASAFLAETPTPTQAELAALLDTLDQNTEAAVRMAVRLARFEAFSEALEVVARYGVHGPHTGAIEDLRSAAKPSIPYDAEARHAQAVALAERIGLPHAAAPIEDAQPEDPELAEVMAAHAAGHSASAACELCGGKEVATCFLCSESKGATHK